MDPKTQCLLVLAKMALQDDNFSIEERHTLEDMSGATGPELDGIIEEAKKAHFQELITGIKSYEDRFLIALRAYIMAHSDRHYDFAEEVHFEHLIQEFGITEEDKKLIERVEKAQRGVIPAQPEPRLMELHKGSSFSK